MSPSSKSPGGETAVTRTLNRPRALLTAIFCAFAALLPIVSVIAPKGTVVLLLLAAALAVPTYWWAHRRFPIPDLRISIALVLLVVWCAIASAWSDDPTRSLVLALRIAVILAAGMVLLAISAALDDAAKKTYRAVAHRRVRSEPGPHGSGIRARLSAASLLQGGGRRERSGLVQSRRRGDGTDRLAVGGLPLV